MGMHDGGGSPQRPRDEGDQFESALVKNLPNSQKCVSKKFLIPEGQKMYIVHSSAKSLM